MVYGPIIAAMLVFAGAAAMGGNENGAAMYVSTIIMSAVIELVAAVKR